MSEQPSETLAGLLAIFDIRQKAALVEHCRTVKVSRGDLAKLILACDVWAIPIQHYPVFQHHQPEHLALSEANLGALATNGVGPLKSAARKTARKIESMFEQRRLFCGHMFWPPANPGEWHLFYFDQRDTDKHRNHWEHGRHIHLMNMLTHPRLNPNELLETIMAAKRPKLGGSLHLRLIE